MGNDKDMSGVYSIFNVLDIPQDQHEILAKKVLLEDDHIVANLESNATTFHGEPVIFTNNELEKVSKEEDRQVKLLACLRSDLPAAQISRGGSFAGADSMNRVATRFWLRAQLFRCTTEALEQGEQLPYFTGVQLMECRAGVQRKKSSTMQEKIELQAEIQQLEAQLMLRQDQMQYLTWEMDALEEDEQIITDLKLIAELYDQSTLLNR
ncbi:hypothetical protein GYMLUDRAFT_62023 [Collybiopsis luxurians FD-317 M1]|uniref:Uncharacterized protein n=1 Tax=Collybiopsis luxurians FD-317 M1 TaxID=944289 RepID=A0A0D0CMD9_9AGAR|nr:hypothetical protein GYMLUDRAFT_62023 [Collybiopsis luxurians FD-317 M1]